MQKLFYCIYNIDFVLFNVYFKYFEQQNSNKLLKKAPFIIIIIGAKSQYRYVISRAKINIFPLQTTLIDI